MNWKILSVILLSVFSAFSIFLFSLFEAEKFPDLNQKLIELTFQFILIVVIGGIISYLFNQHLKRIEQDREKQAAAIELDRIENESRLKKTNSLKENHYITYSEVVRLYNETKKVRRLLRAEAIRINSDRQDIVIYSKYKKLMIELINVQLAFEAMVRRCRVEREYFKQIEGFSGNLNEICDYLGELINEFEQSTISLDEPDYLTLSSLNKLAEFVGKRKNNSDDGIFIQFKNIQSIIWNAIRVLDNNKNN